MIITHRPMSHISAIFGTDDDAEILTSLYLIVNVSLLTFMKQMSLKQSRTRKGWASFMSLSPS